MARRTRKITDYNTGAASGSGVLARTGHWWMASTKTKVVSIIFMITVVGGVLAMLVLPDPEQATASPAPAVTTPSSGSTVAPQAPVCPAQAAVQVSPEKVVLTTYKTTWTRIGDMREPSSKDAGPGMKDPWPQCFSRTPEGALYAAASFAANAVGAAERGQLEEFFTARASHTGNFDMLIADLPAGSPPQNRPTVTVSGYLWNSYTPDMVSVQIRYRAITGSSTATVYTLTWENNDWRLIVPGKSDIVNQDPANKSFTPWGGT